MDLHVCAESLSQETHPSALLFPSPTKLEMYLQCYLLMFLVFVYWLVDVHVCKHVRQGLS